VATTFTYINVGDCHSTEAVPVTSCGGSCGTSSMYSLEAQLFQHSCSCCQEKATSKKEVSMVCTDGRKFNHSYIYIEECSCLQTECAPTTNATCPRC
uniref:CTCK domain-containing protein n=1 Tax=Scleropages formosus TaxID=113540 RepID=A0A8C9SA87_SCLFO